MEERLDVIDFDVELAVETNPRTAAIYSIMKHHASGNLILISFSGIRNAYEFITRRMWENSIRDLEELGLIRIIKDKKQRKEFIALRNKSQKEYGIIRCEWCNSLTDVIDEHHYPIPRSLGGKDIVKICPNCHSAYHNGVLIELLEEVYNE